MLQYKAVHNIDGKIAYLGDEYSYSHAAAEMLTDAELCAFDSISSVIAAVGNGCVGAVLPLENNTEGAVGEVYDALIERKLKISAQAVLPVTHSLIAARGTDVSDITQIVSHAQAIGQCRKFLSGMPCKVIAAPSTSAALKQASGTTAAIAFKPRSGQVALRVGIQDSALNATRFALVGDAPSGDGGTVSVRFDVPNAPGALAKVLDHIYERGVNLTRIISRPHRSGNGEYRFFVDFDYSGESAELDAFLRGMGEYCSELDFIGRYDIINQFPLGKR